MELKYLGHSCFFYSDDLISLIIDPFLTGNPQNQIDIRDIKVDYVLITHGHSDHIGDAIEICKNNNATIIANYEVSAWCSKFDIKTMGLNIGGSVILSASTIKLVNAIHSSQMQDGTYGGNPAGFIIHNKNICFYHAGDTALHMDMKLIPMIAPQLNFAILPIGDYYTMGIDDCTIASEFIQCNKIIACHFDTFPTIQLNHNKALETFNNKKINLIIPKYNELISIN